MLDEATRATGKGVTATVIEGLAELRKRELRSALRRLEGKVEFELDLRRDATLILIDTSAWIDFFRGKGALVSAVDDALEDPPALWEEAGDLGFFLAMRISRR